VTFLFLTFSLPPYGVCPGRLRLFFSPPPTPKFLLVPRRASLPLTPLPPTSLAFTLPGASEWRGGSAHCPQPPVYQFWFFPSPLRASGGLASWFVPGQLVSPPLPLFLFLFATPRLCACRPTACFTRLPRPYNFLSLSSPPTPFCLQRSLYVICWHSPFSPPRFRASSASKSTGSCSSNCVVFFVSLSNAPSLPFNVCVAVSAVQRLPQY